MRRVAFIGHRGVGKTTFLGRVTEYLKDKSIKFIDLDQEITNRTGRSLKDIFLEDKEVGFRKLELDVFQTIDHELNINNEVLLDREVPLDKEVNNKNPGFRIQEPQAVFLILGAGFDPRNIPETWEVIWLRRASDAGGRIFFDRPRLNANIPSLQEFMERYQQRQIAYENRADQVLFLDEGLESFDPIERAFVREEFQNLSGTMTLLPSQFHSELKFRRWTHSRLQWGLQHFELRDDLLTFEQMNLALNIVPKERLILSFRDPLRIPQTFLLIKNYELLFDWPLEFGPCNVKKPNIISLHRREQGVSLKKTLEQFEVIKDSEILLKAALPTYNFHDLDSGRRWQKEQPSRRSFLPHSTEGRWVWDRLLASSEQPLNFIREGQGSGPDQPTLLQWARYRSLQNSTNFAAVLGDPVSHSRTPAEQGPFFAKRKIPIFAIQVQKKEWEEGALESLRSRGLAFAAVTAPLKHHALAQATCDSKALNLQAANTLIWKSKWVATNTDLVGFKKAIEDIGELGIVAVWGGGGTLGVIKTVLPQAHLYSQRTGSPRFGNGVESPDTVIWAAGAMTMNGSAPPKTWRPKRIFDLSYNENSPGRAYALEKGSIYISGLKMFNEQAAAQRRFWEVT